MCLFPMAEKKFATKKIFQQGEPFDLLEFLTDSWVSALYHSDFHDVLLRRIKTESKDVRTNPEKVKEHLLKFLKDAHELSGLAEYVLPES